MLKISELIGKELICLNGAELAGVVGNVLFDKKLRAAKYLQILSDDEKEPEIQFVEFRRVKNPEADACVIANRSTLLCEWAIPAGLAVSPMNCACFDTNGQRLGYVRDIVLAEKNLVETILVSADIPHSSLLIPNLEFSPARLLSYSDRMLIINDAEKPVKLKKTRPRVPKNAGVVRVRVHGKEQGAERAKQITNSEKNIPNPSATPHSSLLIPNSYPNLPDETMFGSLTRYLTTPNENFQPMNSNFGLLPPLDIRDKALRHKALSERSLKALAEWIAAQKQLKQLKQLKQPQNNP